MTSKSSNNYVPRVTQLDALQLDDEIVNIFKNQLVEATKHFSPGLLTPITAELEWLIRSLIFRYSVYQNGSTFGQHMLSLKYDKSNISPSKLRWFYFYTVLIKYIKDRLLLSYTSNKTAQRVISSIEKFQIIGDFLNFLRFLQTGKNPALIDYVLNLEVCTENYNVNKFTEYMWTRELLWHSFVELLGFAAPLLKTRIVKKAINETIPRIFSQKKEIQYSSFLNASPVMKRSSLCAECNNFPIIPYHMGCEHIFCHYCLQGNKIQNSYYGCPKCNFVGQKLSPIPSG